MTTKPSTESDAIQTIGRHKQQDVDLSDVARSLTNAHAHRPGLWQQDLEQANKALQGKHLLPDLKIVGIKGQDFIVEDKQGNQHAVDSHDTRRQQDVYGSSTTDVNGRKANLTPDGSGTVVAGRDDKHGWVLSKDLLKAQGNGNPSSNEMANFQKELEKLNGKPVSQFKPGDEIKVPPATKGGDQTSFDAQRRGDQSEAAKAADKQQVEKQAKEGDDAVKKFGYDDNKGYGPRLTKDGIEGALKRTDLTDADKRGLEFLKAHYDEFKTPGSFSDWGIYGSAAGSSYAKIDSWKQQQQKLIDQRLESYNF